MEKDEVRNNEQIEYKNTLLQCQECGKIYVAKIKSTDDGFVHLWCSECQQVTTQLDLENEDDKYMYLNINVDPSYY